MNVRQEILIHASPIRVWRMLTEPVELEQWASDKADVSVDTYHLHGTGLPYDSMEASILLRDPGSGLRLIWPIDGTETTVEIKLLAEPAPEGPQGVFSRVVVSHDQLLNQDGETSTQWSWQTHWSLWLHRLKRWAERSRHSKPFEKVRGENPMVVRHVVIEATPEAIWPFLIDSERRQSWFHEPLGDLLESAPHRHISFAGTEDFLGQVTFYLEPRPHGETLVIVEHVGIDADQHPDYVLGWDDYLAALEDVSARPLIRQTVWIDATPEEVWPWFTSESRFRAWWNKSTEVTLSVGGRIAFYDHEANLVGRITEWIPTQRMSFTMGIEGLDNVLEPFVIILDLHAERHGTRVTVTHEGFDRLPAALRDRLFRGFQTGWADSWEIDRLKQAVESAPNQA